MLSNLTESDILQTLSNRTNNAVSSLTVRFDKGHVVISGRAPSYYAKQVVTQTALAHVGSRQVRNEISVSPRSANAELYS